MNSNAKNKRVGILVIELSEEFNFCITSQRKIGDRPTDKIYKEWLFFHTFLAPLAFSN